MQRMNINCRNVGRGPCLEGNSRHSSSADCPRGCGPGPGRSGPGCSTKPDKKPTSKQNIATQRNVRSDNILCNQEGTPLFIGLHGEHVGMHALRASMHINTQELLQGSSPVSSLTVFAIKVYFCVDKSGTGSSKLFSSRCSGPAEVSNTRCLQRA
mgnify:CR=1 FL=1